MSADKRNCARWRGTPLMEQRFVCPLCETLIADSNTAHVDHIVPLSRGGSSDKANLQAVHARCNHRKNSSLESELDLPLPAPSEDRGRWRAPVPNPARAIVRTTQIPAIDQLRQMLADMFGRAFTRREALDVAVLQLERWLDAGLPIGPGISEITRRGRRS